MTNKKKWNIAINCIITLLGIVFCFLKGVFISIGTSLIGAAVGSFVTIMFAPDERNKDNSIIRKWKLVKIYHHRTEKNMESDALLPKTKKTIDGIAFGLRTWRENNSDEILNALNRGVNIRLITMNPSSSHTSERSIEEDKNENIAESIKDLIEFAKNINEKSSKGKITIKGYNCMTLDFYWRMDENLYIGPYLYKISSGSTITYKYESGGKGFDYYRKYFESLWNDSSLIDLVTI